MTFPDLLRKSCAAFADLDVVSQDHRRQTYGELGERARRLANGLSALGLRPGDRIATLEDNRLDSLEKVAALALGGYVRCPMYTLNVAATHAYMLDLVGARAIIVEARYAADIARIRASVPTLEIVIVVGDGPADGAGTVDYETLLAAADDAWPEVDVDPDAAHVIRFSAGTTGKPKGIVHTNRGWLAMTNEWAMLFPRVVPGDAYLAAAPFSHATGMSIWVALARGGRFVVASGFEPTAYLRLAARERVAHLLLVPTMLQMLTTAPGAGDIDLSALKSIQYGAAPISERLLRTCIGLWGNVFYQVFGQSECLPATVLYPEDHRTSGSADDQRRLTSVGRPTPNSVVTIRDDDGVQVPDGEVGEICTRSPGAMAGIWGDPAATAERILPDGAVRSRDMGYRDPDGYVHIVDRKEDLIISGGYNVWPLEVEHALAAHPDVVEACVVGVPDEKWGEIAVALVHTGPGAAVSGEELRAFARSAIGPVKAPKHVWISAEPLPKSAVGKLLRRSAREAYLAEHPTVGV